MSDCFDHMVDAYESYDRSIDDGGPLYSSSFSPDKLYFHKRISFIKIENETDKAYLFRLSDVEGVWVPKSICKNLGDNEVFVHRKIYSKIKSIEI